MAPTVVVEVEEESSVEVFEASTSVEKVGDQAGKQWMRLFMIFWRKEQVLSLF